MKNPQSMSQFKREYLKIKERKHEKRKKSKVLHPIRTAKRSYKSASTVTKDYWDTGKQIGRGRVEKTPIYYARDKDVAKYVYGHMSLKQKIFGGIFVALVLTVIVLGALNQ